MPIALTRRLAFVAAATSLALIVVADDRGGIIAPLAVLNAGLLVLAAVDALLAPRADRVVIDRHLPPVLALGTTAPISWRVSNRSGRGLRLWLADELAPSLRATHRRITARVPRRGARKHVPRSTPLGAACSASSASSCASPARSGSVHGRPRCACRVRSGCTRRSAAGTKRSCASTGRGSSRSGCARRRGGAAAPTSTRCGSTRSTTSPAASTGRRPRGGQGHGPQLPS